METFMALKRSRDVRIEEDVEFDALISNKDLLKGIKASGYERPSPIQLKAIPLGRLGVDMIAQAKSGTGKTVVFGTIALEGIDLTLADPQVLIVAPTREIAVQITEVLRVLGTFMKNLQCQTFIGGLSVKGDSAKLQQCQVVVGTPGRLMALIQQNRLRISNIKLAVLDEADKLIGDDFKAQTKYLLDKLPDQKQVIAFSATFEETLYDTLQNYMHNPHKVVLTTDAPVLEGVQQYYVPVNVEEVDSSLIQIRLYEQKFKTVVELMEKIPFYQCIVFLNHRGRAVDLTQYLNRNGWMSCHISSGISQQQRLEVMQKARKFRIRVLICSDLISRGIDIDRVNLVLNLDFPKDIETYLHRVGRTGRYGTSGIAVNVISPQDSEFMQKLADNGIQVKALPDQVGLGSFTKELVTSELKILEDHEKKRRRTSSKAVTKRKVPQPAKVQHTKANIPTSINEAFTPEKAIEHDNPVMSNETKVLEHDEQSPNVVLDSNSTYCQTFPSQYHRTVTCVPVYEMVDPPDLFY